MGEQYCIWGSHPPFSNLTTSYIWVAYTKIALKHFTRPYCNPFTSPWATDIYFMTGHITSHRSYICIKIHIHSRYPVVLD